MTGVFADGYIPFLDPINAVHVWWYVLVIPLSFGVSVIYRALRVPSLDHFWRGVGIMTVQIVVAMVALAILLIILVEVVVPLVWTE